MRDFHDAKAMAQTLRDALAEKKIALSHSESLELVARTLGIADWNTLSAMLHEDKRKGAPVKPSGTSKALPAIPIRDFVPFPGSTFPLYVGREGTKQALDHAFANHREVVLFIQKDPSMDDPGPDDIHETGVSGTLLDVEHLPDGLTFAGRTVPAGAMKILIHAHKRTVLRRFFKESGAYYAEAHELAASAASDNVALMRNTVERFESYVAVHKINVPQIWPSLAKGRDVGRIADFISQHLVLPIAEKHMLLATHDPVARLEKINAMIDSHGAAVKATRTDR